MIRQFNTKRTLITTVIILTLLLSWFIGYNTEQGMRNNFLTQTQIGANSIDANLVKKLTGTQADVKSPAYRLLKQQFANIIKVNKQLHFAYLMGVKPNGKVFFYVDDKPDGDPEGSAPGSPYDEAPKEFNEVMQTGIPVVQGPSSDSWGSYASGCAPVIDPQTGKTIAIFAIDFATGSWYWEIALHSALPFGLGVALMLIVISFFVTKQNSNLLRKSEERYRFMFDNNPQPNWIFDLETLAFLEVNEAAIHHYGYSREEFLSMTIKDIRPPEDIQLLLDDIRMSSAKGLHEAIERRHIKKNGDLIYVAVASHTVIFNGRESLHILVHDITDRILAEAELRKTKNELEKLHNNMDEAVLSVDLIQVKTLYASIANQTVFGRSPAEFLENPRLWFEVIHPEDKPKVETNFPVLYSGNKFDHEYRIIRPNGDIRWIEAKIKPTLDENGKLIQIDGIAYDITYRKEIETKLLESEINFRRSIAESPVGIRIVSVDEKTVYANKAFLDIYEFETLEEFTNTPAKNRYTPESYIQHLQRKEKRKVGIEESDYEIGIICKNGNIRYVKVSYKEILWNGTIHFQVVNIDITELRNSEEQLRKFASYLQNIREEEKVSIAREIHDDLGQILVALKIDMGMLKQKVSKTNVFEKSSNILHKFDDIVDLINRTIITTRRIMNGLRPELLEMHGFVGATKDYLREFEDRHKIICEFIFNDSDIKMTPQQSLAFFRIFQEAMNNVAKHAKATSVLIQLQHTDNKLSLEITDNGVGLDKDNQIRPDSYGMIGMKERVILLEGKLDIISATGKGTSVRIEIPYQG